MKIVETCNLGGDYLDERYLNLPWLTEDRAKKIVDVINEALCNYPGATRIWKVVPDDYKLQPGFEP